jgi:Lectin C-type domain
MTIHFPPKSPATIGGLIVLWGAAVACGAPVTVVFNPATQTLQVYQVIPTPGTDTWAEAFTDAATKSYKGVTGHLATIRSEAENTVVSNTMGPVIGGGGLSWIGATDDPTFTLSVVGEGDWRWVGDSVNGGTPDAFWSGGPGGMPVDGKYNNWNTGEPNNAGPGEQYADIVGPNSGAPDNPVRRKWNDLDGVTGRGEYLIEYDSVPIANFGEQFTNGHRYEVIGGLPMTVAQARAAAQALPSPTGFQQGDLAKVDSAELQAFLTNLVATDGLNDGGYHPWIGASDEAVEGEWRWFDGTQFWQGGTAATGGMPVGGQYNNWDPGEPNNVGEEDFVVMNPFAGDGDWFDLSSAATRASFVVEWRPLVAVAGDYNKNGTVDAADYVVWREAQSSGATTLDNRDPSLTGPVGNADYQYWRARFGNTSGSGAGGNLGQSAAVPEPSAGALLMLAAVGGVILRWQRRSPRARRDD